MNSANWAKYFLGALLLTYIFAVFAYIIVKIFNGAEITGGDIFAGIIGGALIPWGTNIIQFFFRKSSTAEDAASTNGNGTVV